MDNNRFKKIFIWISGIGFLLYVGFLFYWLTYAGVSPEIMSSFETHICAVVSLPSAAFAALMLVLILEQSYGNVKFSGLGFQFEGASGQVVLWVLCFLAMVLGIKVLW